MFSFAYLLEGCAVGAGKLTGDIPRLNGSCSKIYTA